MFKYTEGMNLDAFSRDERTYDAVVRNIEIIGEAAKQLPGEVRESMSNIEWKKAAGLRDMLAHAYFGIDSDILWDVIEHKIPQLHKAIIQFRASEGDSGSWKS